MLCRRLCVSSQKLSVCACIHSYACAYAALNFLCIVTIRACMFMYVVICVYVHTYVYMCLCMHQKSERSVYNLQIKKIDALSKGLMRYQKDTKAVCMCMYVVICVYVHTYVCICVSMYA